MKRTRNVYHLQIRKQRRMADILKKNALLNACINDKGDIFSEIKKLRKTSQSCSATIDGVDNRIEDEFANIYSDL